METQHNIHQKLKNLSQKNDSSLKSFSSSSFHNEYLNKTSYTSRPNKEPFSTSAETYSIKSSNPNREKPNIFNNIILTNTKNNFVNELFKAFGENNSLCNFSLFVKNVDIEMNLDENILKKITLSEYFQSFIEGSFLCLNIPFLDKKGNINYNIFNPTLSSMYLILNKKKIKPKLNPKLSIDNFTITDLNDESIKIEFDETNPPYNRDIIENKIKIVHKLIGTKNIFLNDIDKEKSFFSILWTPADTYKIKSSFLSVYTFDFKLIGTLIIKLEESNWFLIYTNDANFTCHKEFKSEYVKNVNYVENFMKKCMGINDEEKLDRKLFPQDYKRFIYSY